MGSEKVILIQDCASRERHVRHLLRDLKALQMMLEADVFEKGIERIGAEQELCFVDECWRPAPVIMEVLDKLSDPHFTTEFARFNMEINLDPVVLKGACLSDYEKVLKSYLDKGEAAANAVGAHLLLTGILPSIRFSDFKSENLTPLPRYHALVNFLHELRGGLFEFRIEGPDTLITHDGLALFEGSNTSFQVHLQVHPSEFAKLYNWSLAITAPLMAATCNSPLLLGKRLWRETRIALFQQSIDTRSVSEQFRDRSPRVTFGSGWIKDSILEIHKDNIMRHKIMLGSTIEEDAIEVLRNGGIPKLYALNIHNGTVYNWNRPCYGITDGKPHLRIEMRVMPAGPSVVDEIANAAFWIGMMKGMPEQYADISKKMDFDLAKDNFIKAARQGLGAYFYWSNRNKQISPSDLILKELLPIARDGLEKAHIDPVDIDKYLGIIRERVETSRTGAHWQLVSFQKLKKMGTKDEALVATTAAMFRRQQEGKPVHRWTLAELSEAGIWVNRYWTIEQIMTTDLFTANEDDPLDLVANLMDWRNIRHLPVENNKGELVGILTCKHMMRYYSQTQNHPITASVREVMSKQMLTVAPDMKTVDAISLMKENDVSCLPVVQNGKLVGLVTEYDFVHIAANLLNEWAAGKSIETPKTT